MTEGIKELLEEKYNQYNTIDFIENDPVLIPHQFTRKEDIEIAGFLTATISWGNRKSIIKNATDLMHFMDDSPHEFILHFTAKDQKPFERFVHRTFNGQDCIFFLRSLQHIYKNKGGLEKAFISGMGKSDEDVKKAIIGFRNLFIETKHLHRSEKHLSDPNRNSSAKRLCMYLRWMVRNDKRGVDFGLWKGIKPSQLCLPLDVHTGNVGRLLGLLQRKQNDWTAVQEITNALRAFDKKDPIKYDFALFGIGVNKDL